MQDQPSDAIVPPPETIHDDPPRVRRRRPLARWVRLCLVGMAVGWVGVFFVAWRLDPYQDGKVWLEETHRQMGLPPCTFKEITSLPCPSCGMTSSFALTVRGDLWHALQANAVGMGLALLGLAFIPWSLVSVYQGRWLWVRSIDALMIRVTVCFLIAMFLRWGIVLLLIWWNRS